MYTLAFTCTRHDKINSLTSIIMPLEGLWTKLQAYKWMSRKDMNHQANNNFLHFPGDILAFTVI